jgi:hypothetical protein
VYCYVLQLPDVKPSAACCQQTKEAAKGRFWFLESDI